MCYKVLDRWVNGVLQLGKRSAKKMKNKNPYLSLMVLWIIASCISLSACIVGIVGGDFWIAFVNLALVVVDSIYLGLTIGKYREIENSMKLFDSYLQILMEKQNEPFKEFEENE